MVTSVGGRRGREEAEMTPKSQIDPLAVRARAAAAVGDPPRPPVEVEDGYRCHQQPLLLLSADLFWSSSILQAGNLFIGQCRAVLTEDNPLYTSPLLLSAPPTFIPVCRRDGRPADFIAV